MERWGISLACGHMSTVSSWICAKHNVDVEDYDAELVLATLGKIGIITEKDIRCRKEMLQELRKNYNIKISADSDCTTLLALCSGSRQLTLYILGPLLKGRPKLTSILLRKPPFRFIADIIRKVVAFQFETLPPFMKHLKADVKLMNVEERTGFLNAFITYTDNLLEEHCPVTKIMQDEHPMGPSSWIHDARKLIDRISSKRVLAGVHPDHTCILLMIFALLVPGYETTLKHQIEMTAKEERNTLTGSSKTSLHDVALGGVAGQSIAMQGQPVFSVNVMKKQDDSLQNAYESCSSPHVLSSASPNSLKSYCSLSCVTSVENVHEHHVASSLPKPIYSQPNMVPSPPSSRASMYTLDTSSASTPNTIQIKISVPVGCCSPPPSPLESERVKKAQETQKKIRNNSEILHMESRPKKDNGNKSSALRKKQKKKLKMKPKVLTPTHGLADGSSFTSSSTSSTQGNATMNASTSSSTPSDLLSDEVTSSLQSETSCDYSKRKSENELLLLDALAHFEKEMSHLSMIEEEGEMEAVMETLRESQPPFKTPSCDVSFETTTLSMSLEEKSNKVDNHDDIEPNKSSSFVSKIRSIRPEVSGRKQPSFPVRTSPSLTSNAVVKQDPAKTSSALVQTHSQLSLKSSSRTCSEALVVGTRQDDIDLCHELPDELWEMAGIEQLSLERKSIHEPRQRLCRESSTMLDDKEDGKFSQGRINQETKLLLMTNENDLNSVNAHEEISSTQRRDEHPHKKKKKHSTETYDEFEHEWEESWKRLKKWLHKKSESRKKEAHSFKYGIHQPSSSKQSLKYRQSAKASVNGRASYQERMKAFKTMYQEYLGSYRTSANEDHDPKCKAELQLSLDSIPFPLVDEPILCFTTTDTISEKKKKLKETLLFWHPDHFYGMIKQLQALLRVTEGQDELRSEKEFQEAEQLLEAAHEVTRRIIVEKAVLKEKS